MPPRAIDWESISRSRASQSPKVLATTSSRAAEAAGSSDAAQRSVHRPWTAPLTSNTANAAVTDRARANRDTLPIIRHLLPLGLGASANRPALAPEQPFACLN